MNWPCNPAAGKLHVFQTELGPRVFPTSYLMREGNVLINSAYHGVYTLPHEHVFKWAMPFYFLEMQS